MPSSYAIQVINPSDTGPILADRTVVYADTELEARITGSEMLGVSPDRLTVTVIESVPSDAEVNALQEKVRESQAQIADAGPSFSYQ